MSFSQPLFLLFLLTVPVLIFLYMIKPRHKKVTIPSTFLWERLKKQKRVAKPAQKLRFSLLLLLGIFALFSFSMYLASPNIFIKNTGKNVVFVFDNGASMSSKSDDSKSYLQKSKEIAKDIIDMLPATAKVSIVTFSDTIEVLQKEGTRSFAKDAIDKVTQTYYATNLKSSLALVSKLFKPSDKTLFIFTDKNVPHLENAKLYKFPKPKDNVSIENISCVSRKEGFDALIEIKNRGIKKASFEFELFADGRLVGLKSISLLPGKIVTFLFENIKGNYKVVWGRINYPDQVTKDNVFWTVLEPLMAKQKVLYVGKGNFFFEKVWLTFDDVEFYKTQDVKNIAGDFDIYIFDQCIPQKFPQKGAFIFVLPNNGSASKLLGIKIGKSASNEGYARFVKSAISQNIIGMDFAVQKTVSIDEKAFEPVAKIGGKPIISFGSIHNHPSILFGFALDNSDLPLKVSFPILMANIKSAFVKKNQLFEKTAFYPGEEIRVFSYSDKKADLILPDGKREIVDLSGYPSILPKKDVLGVYSLILSEESKENYKFAINFPTYALDLTDDRLAKSDAHFSDTSKINSVKMPYSLKDIFLILALIFLSLEWMVFLNENRV
ncbi:von Willebrand factor type A [Caldicellulosiruptor obsidiansis OB47]|uniref:von Willebrand factor type A n=1 Tax=Caldicellulosiruptor obsidiansis (strain ATCC BAA-2073 / JCM 16842 / OB47) TaxID=608506 RepID=D9TGT1_CALOO|nr:BatA and WFA domain-containing protein [Caldicellulosiruptor obsidiansis]ADL41417.1 von Willebrand factor type A [Caldicellulosiruptor obsidiansis OB47]